MIGRWRGARGGSGRSVTCSGLRARMKPSRVSISSSLISGTRPPATLDNARCVREANDRSFVVQLIREREASVVKAAVNRRDEILDVARELFARHGYTATSMRDIAHADGIKASSLYSHFRSKAEILRLVVTPFTDDVAPRAAAGVRGRRHRSGAAAGDGGGSARGVHRARPGHVDPPLQLAADPRQRGSGRTGRDQRRDLRPLAAGDPRRRRRRLAPRRRRPAGRHPPRHRARCRASPTASATSTRWASPRVAASSGCSPTSMRSCSRASPPSARWRPSP